MNGHADELPCTRAADGVVLLTLNRPQARNAITHAQQRALDARLRELDADDSVRAIVITGAGAAFSSGYDIKEMAAHDADTMQAQYAERLALMGAVAHYRKPLVGAINGLAHGAGAILATVLDIRIGAARCDFRFTAALYNGVNNTWQLPQIVGIGKALEYTMTGRRISADEALQAQLLNQVVADGDVLARSVEIAALIAANPPDGVCGTKRLIREGVGRSRDEAYAVENALMAGSLRPQAPAAVFKDFLAGHPKR